MGLLSQIEDEKCDLISALKKLSEEYKHLWCAVWQCPLDEYRDNDKESAVIEACRQATAEARARQNIRRIRRAWEDGVTEVEGNPWRERMESLIVDADEGTQGVISEAMHREFYEMFDGRTMVQIKLEMARLRAQLDEIIHATRTLNEELHKAATGVPTEDSLCYLCYELEKALKNAGCDV